MGKIWCRGKYWDVDTYNKKLSKENKLDYEYEKKIEPLEKEQKRLEEELNNKIEELWKD